MLIVSICMGKSIRIQRIKKFHPVTLKGTIQNEQLHAYWINMYGKIYKKSKE